jgi:hypothetical protein
MVGLLQDVEGKNFIKKWQQYLKSKLQNDYKYPAARVILTKI